MIGEALAYRGHRLVPRYFPLARVPLAFRQGEVQAAMTDLGQDLSPQGAHYGEPAVLYRNVLVSLQGRRLQIEKPEDLQGLSIVAFQGAAKRYPEWLAASESAGLYFEQLLERTSLFKAKAVVFHPFVEEDSQNYRPLFRSQQIRDDFNADLRHLKASGRYQAIYDSYLQ